MKPLNLISQICVIGAAIGIVLLYTRPAFSGIADTQGQIAEYKTLRQKIEGVNAQLSQYAGAIDSIPISDVQRLETYLPQTVDEVAVMRDVQEIAEQSALLVQSVDSEIPSGVQSSSDFADRYPNVSRSYITLSANGSYEDIKNFLDKAAQNQYLLEASMLELSRLQDGLVNLTVTFAVYAVDIDVDESNQL